MNRGYIALHKKFLDWQWYDNANVTRLFLHCLLKANWKTKSWKGIVIKRGQFVTSRHKLSTALGISESAVKESLKKLKKSKEITSTATNKFSIITVVKYDEYQKKENANDLQNDSETPSTATSNAPTTIYNNKTIDKEDTKVSKKRKRFIKPSVEEIYQYMKSRWIEKKIDAWGVKEEHWREKAKYFFDKQESVGWKIGTKPMKDWKATIRTWEYNHNKWENEK